MSRKPGLTLDEHRALGAELQAIRDRLVKITVITGNSYPAKVGRCASRAVETIDKLRSELDNRMFAENPNNGMMANVYYCHGGKLNCGNIGNCGKV